MSIETKLYVEIDEEFEALSKIEVGSDTYRTTVDGITKLMDRAIELEKLNKEQEEKAKTHKFESDLKERQTEFENGLKIRQMEEDKRDRLVKNCLAGAGIAIPALLTIWGTIKSIKFEETGTITTLMGRGFIQKLLPKK